MIAYIEGKLTFKSPTHVYIDTGGLGYEVQVSLNTYAHLESLSAVKLFTQLIVREDAQILFGFADEEEKKLFNLLISVSGIGPNTARMILSYMSPGETAAAILEDNVAAFKKVKGVGPKTAKRLIVDLKDKLAKIEIENLESTPVHKADTQIKDEAVVALMSLGFQKSQISKMVEKVLKADPDITQVEVLIKNVLRQLS